MELRIDHMTKQFQDKRAVNDVSLKLTPGVWVLLGANGAGKTTLMRMVAGILQPTKGVIYYDGIEIGTLGAAWRDVFGYLPQEFGFYPEFTVKNYLEYMAALKGLTKTDTKKRIHDLLELLTLSEVKNKKIAKLSGGMKRRLALARALLAVSDAVALDEPFTGLDEENRRRAVLCVAAAAETKSVILVTHDRTELNLLRANIVNL